MKVHFASGTHPFPKPWWNVDLNDWPQGVDERVDLLSGDWGSIEAVTLAYVGHWLEHITNAEGYTFLYRLREVMVPGSTAVFVGPDVNRAQEQHERGLMSDDLLFACRPHGVPEGGDGHNRAGCHLSPTTATNVSRLLEDTGWSNVRSPTWMALAGMGIPVINASDWQYCLTANA